uniref:CCHC-type domain-containing protein n=1 Tax=Cyprinus carpio TaxID=7962 RepID=A0A8C1TEZ2_CYPCA
MAKPAPFFGSAEDCSGFLLQCSLVLEMQPHIFPTERSKVAFVISQLKGKALQWADSIWIQNNPVIQSYTSFVDHFREVFGKPTWDSSIGEKLYNLKQGKMSVNEYVLQFRTLAATSGWNEQALITTYRQGLDPRVRLHLAAYEDTIGRFIQLSIRFATCMQSCLEEHQGQPQHNISLCQPEPVSPPEPAHEPMQLDSTRLTGAERQRRLTQNLCLYCGSPGHILSTCPIRPPRSLVSAIFPTTNQMKPLTTIVTLTAADISLPVNALLDSGSAGNFISGSLCRQLHLPTTATQSSYQIHSITGKPLSRRRVRRRVGPIQLQVGILHKEMIHLLVLEESTTDVVLGRPWLEQHNPVLSWSTGKILKWGETCFMDCFPEVPVPSSQLHQPLSVCATSIESPLEKRSVDIPPCYAPFSDVFCPERASKLPPHWLWDTLICYRVSQCQGEGSIPFPSRRRRPWRNTSRRLWLKATSVHPLPLLLRASSSWRKRTEACGPALTTKTSTRLLSSSDNPFLLSQQPWNTSIVPLSSPSWISAARITSSGYARGTSGRQPSSHPLDTTNTL